MRKLARVETVDILRQLEQAGAVTPVSLEIADHDLDWDRFAALCTYLGALRNATAWWIGDALNFADAVYGFSASQAEALLGRSPETLRRWQWVATNVPKSRRNPRLSFTHHESVASLLPDEQARWLDRAEGDLLTVGELRAQLVEWRARSSANDEGVRSANELQGPDRSPDPELSLDSTDSDQHGEPRPGAALGPLEGALRDLRLHACPHRRGAFHFYEVRAQDFERLIEIVDGLELALVETGQATRRSA